MHFLLVVARQLFLQSHGRTDDARAHTQHFNCQRAILTGLIVLPVGFWYISSHIVYVITTTCVYCNVPLIPRTTLALARALIVEQSVSQSVHHRFPSPHNQFLKTKECNLKSLVRYFHLLTNNLARKAHGDGRTDGPVCCCPQVHHQQQHVAAWLAGEWIWMRGWLVVIVLYSSSTEYSTGERQRRTRV